MSVLSFTDADLASIIEQAQTDAYAEGRKDEREDNFKHPRDKHLCYFTVLCEALKTDVEVGCEYVPEDLGHREYPDTPAHLLVQEVWMSGVDLVNGLAQDVLDRLEDAAHAHWDDNERQQRANDHAEHQWELQQDAAMERGYP